jgi:RHS repeat-associated protein
MESRTSALRSNVLVTLIDGWGNPVAGEWITAVNDDGPTPDSGETNSQGVATVNVDSGTYKFRVTYGGVYFESPACTTPGCTSATIEITKPVQVTVTDGFGGGVPDQDVFAVDDQGILGSSGTTNSLGIASVYAIPGAYLFRVIAGGMYFDSSTSNDCTIPGCTSASIVVAHVLVTVKGTNGIPAAGVTVMAVDANLTPISWIDTDSAGHSDMFVPAGTYLFRAIVNGDYYESGPTGHCAVPGCVAASITIPACVGQDEGTACEDGDLCTQGDTCQAGVCSGGAPITCAQDLCHNAGTCNPATGTCSSTRVADGTACNDGNRCTSGDNCRAGTCFPGTTNTCVGTGQPNYAQIIDLGSAQGYSYARSINSSGVVVGTDTVNADIYQLGYPGSKGFHWSESEGRIPLPWNGAQSYGVDINDAGVMSVTAGVDPWAKLPCRFDPAVDAQPVCNPYAGGAAAINASGTLTGVSYYPASAVRMFRLGTGPMETLPSIPSSDWYDLQAVGYGIADDGSVVGGQYLGGVWQGVRYSDARGMELLADLLPAGSGWSSVGASSIRSGEMLGSGHRGGLGRAVRIKTAPNGDVTEIVGLPVPSTFAPDALNVANAAESNASNEIVGTVYDAIPYWPQAAYVYTDATGSIDLNTLVDPESGWNLLAGFGINDNHEVVGYGTHNGAQRAYKLKLPNLGPCPLPDTCHTGVRDLLTGACTYVAKPNGAACNDGNACTQGDVCTAGICQGPTAIACAAPDTCHAAGTCNGGAAAPPPPSTQDLVGWWKLDGDGVDASGGGHNLTIEGGVTPAPGRVGLGMKFDGTGCMTAPVWPESRMSGASGVSMMAWISTSEGFICPRETTVIGKGWDYSTSVHCFPPAGGTDKPGTGAIVRVAGAVTWGYPGQYGQFYPGEWHLLALTWDHNETHEYLDGKEFRTWPTAGEFGDIDPTFAVGCMISRYWSGDERIKKFVGTIDEAMLYRRVLSTAEIAAYYAAADPCTHPVFADGTTCNDGNLCTQTDTCSAGTCVGANPVVCTAQDACHTAGTCAPSTGVCSNPIFADGTACNDGDSCTQSEMCDAGVCQAPAGSPTILNLVIDDLGGIGGTYASAEDINNRGDVVGTAMIASGELHGFVRPVSGQPTDVGISHPSSAGAINNAGYVTGSASLSDGSHAYRRDAASGGLQDLGLGGDGTVGTDVFAYQGSYGREINSANQVVGDFTVAGAIHGFRYTDGLEDPFEDIGSLAGGLTHASGIDAAGTVVGSSWVPGTPQTTDIRRVGHAMMFHDSEVGMIDLQSLIDPTLGWTLISANDIAGDYIVGTGELNGVLRPFRVRVSTGEVLEITGGWAGQTFGTAVNQFGDTVGWGYLDATQTQAAAFVYSDRFGFKQLNEIANVGSAWNLRIATSINDTGEIVGSGTHNGQTAAFRLNTSPRTVACESQTTCGGGAGGPICLYADGVVDLGEGQYAAVFGFQNAGATSVHPTTNQLFVDGVVVPNPAIAPPAFLIPGNHPGAYIPKVVAGHAITWKVDGATATISAPAPGSTTPPGTRVLGTVPIGTNGAGVIVDGVLVTIRPDTTPPANPTVQPDPAVGDPFNGALAGHLSVSPTGAATYTVPIAIPPGISGMAPNLNLVYSSQGGNGLAGQGWELSGLSVIHRCPKTVVQDGFNRPVHMNGLEPDPAHPTPEGAQQDGVCIDGKRLFQRTISPRTYQPEGEDFSVVTRFYDNPGLANGKATYFTVVTKSGETRFYGSRTKSRVRFPIEEDDIGSGGDEIAVWALDRVVDAWGNYYDIHYNETNGVEQADFTTRGLIVTSISYTGHFEGSRVSPRDGSTVFVPAVPPFTSVSFTYEARNDVRTTRFRQATLPRNQRLKTITTDAGIYKLDYIPGFDPMLPSRLASIGYCATPSPAFPSGQCMKSLDFNWDGGGYEWVAAPAFALPAVLPDSPLVFRGTQLVDLDGDGRADMVSAPAFPDSDAPNGAWRNTGSGWDGKASWKLPSDTSGNVIITDQNNNPASTMFADMDGDGLLDLVGSVYSCTEDDDFNPVTDDRHCNQFPTKVWLNRIKQSGVWQLDTTFNNGPLAPLGATEKLKLGVEDTLADLNHDGRADLIHLALVYYNLPGGWSAPVAIGGANNGLDIGLLGNLHDYHFEDVNRDGFPDFVGNFGTDGAGEYFLYLGLNPTGKLWGPFQDSIPREFTKKPEIADIDGDGRYDRLFSFQTFVPGDGLPNPGIYTGVALGTGLGFEYSESAPAGPPGSSTVAVLYKTGAKIALDATLGAPNENARKFNLPDLNGDGLADLVVDYSAASSPPPTNFFFNIGSAWVNPSSPTATQNLPFVPAGTGGSGFVDLDGDGILDLVQSWKGHPKQAWLNKFQRPILKHFPNGLAQPTDVEYAVITTREATDQGIYTDPAPSSIESGTQYLALPINVVSSVAKDDGRGSITKPKTRYQYASLRNSASGRGPQGFRTMTVIEPGDTTTVGTTTNTTFAQVYPYTGLPVAVTRLKGSTLVTATGTEYCDTIDKNACIPNVGKNYPQKTSIFVYPSVVGDVAFQFSGNQATGTLTTTSEFTYDALGNPTVVSVKTVNNTTGETNRKLTTNVYGTTPSLDGPRLGKITRATVEGQRLAPADGNNSPIVHVTEFDYSLPNMFLMPMQADNRAQNTLALLRTRVEPATIAQTVPPDMTDYIAQHTAFEYDEFGNTITTTACGSDFGSCVPGAVNPSDPSDPSHPPFRTTRVSFDPADFNAPVGLGLTSTLSYGSDNSTGTGRFPVMTTNAAGHKEYSAYDPVKGVLLQKTGPNGIHSCFTYDDLGHPKTQVDRCGTDNLTTTLSQHFTTTADPFPAVLVTVTRPPSGAATWTYKDVLGRQVASLGRSFSGGFIESVSTYDVLGRVATQSQPFLFGDPQYLTTPHYDSFGRVDREQQDLGPIDETGNPAQRTTNTTFLPLAIRTDQVVAGSNQHRLETKNVLGKVGSITDSRDVTLTYWYDADGNLTDAGDPMNHTLPTVHVEYDIRGRKTRSVDPDLGTWTYAYNSFGDLIGQIDAKGQRTTMTYDIVGRMTTKTDAQGTATWVYDVAAGAGIGKLAAMVSAPDAKLNGGPCPIPYGVPTGPNRAARWFTYTATGEVGEAFDCVDGDVFSTGYQYDTLGRQKAVTYPTVNGTRLTLEYRYTSLGYLHYVMDATDSSIYWAATAMNALGQVTGERTRNGVETIKNRSPVTGWVLSAASIAHNDGNAAIQNWAYSYDEAGNVRSRARQDALIGGPSVETFGYDVLNRVTSSEVKVGSYDAIESYFYDDLGLGNLKNKGGKDYHYTGCNAGSRVAGPHAVCSVGTEAPYVYDDNGNLTVGAGRTISYSPFNKVVQINGEQGEVDFAYGADGNRVVQNVLPPAGASSSARTVYVGLGATGKSLYEKTTHGDGPTEHIQFIYAGSAHDGNAFALRITTGSGSSSPATKYYHFDHLGSVTALSDETGHVIGPDAGGATSGVIGYDPWGARRSPDGQAAASSSFTLQPGHREYTGHETIPSIGLVNMNGRVYDPALGRFLSPDPTVQFVTSLQSFNRYSYVLNNPLRNVDPTGYEATLTGSTTPTRTWVMMGGTLALTAVSIYCGGCAGAVFAGLVWNTTTMAMNGAPVWQIVAVDAISLFSGYVGGAIGEMAGPASNASPVGAIVGGAVSGAFVATATALVQGNELGTNVLEGAAMGAVSAAIGWTMQKDALTRAGAEGGLEGDDWGVPPAASRAGGITRAIPVTDADGRVIGYIGVVTYQEQRGGVVIDLVYRSSVGNADDLNWVQTVETNRPIHRQPPHFIDNAGGGGTNYYESPALAAQIRGRGGYNARFWDDPGRTNLAGEAFPDVRWRAETSLVSMRNHNILTTLTWGFSTDVLGRTTAMPLLVAQPSAFQRAAVP